MCIRDRGNVVIPRSLNPERVASNIYFAPLTKNEMKSLDDFGVNTPHRYIGTDMAGVIPGFTHGC